MMTESEYKNKVSYSHRKRYAQFFTPEPIAELMVAWLSYKRDVKALLEPAAGLGIFSRLVCEIMENPDITCFELDPCIFKYVKENFANVSGIKIKNEDYLLNDWNTKYDSIICNPPYFKFHDYDNSVVKTFESTLNINLSGFTNVYTLFLIKSIFQLRDEGRAAYIIPLEFLNSDYGRFIKKYLLKSSSLRHVITFDFKENVFEDVITTSAIFLFAKDKYNSRINFTNIKNIYDIKKINDIIENYPNCRGDFSYDYNDISSDKKWKSYYKTQKRNKFKDLVPFYSIAKVVRGIATGANDYFVFNKNKAQKFDISSDYLLPCITKSKDVKSSFFAKKDFEFLLNNNANVLLFDAAGKDLTPAVTNYINLGEKNEIDKKYLTSRRNPWYAIENRKPAPIWVGVFNRNNLKFVRNEAGIHNLTTFHCIYLINSILYNIEIDLLFSYLLTDSAKTILNDNRREYGNGLNKFEPNDLNNAYMLDLSKLDNYEKENILSLYDKYKLSVINNNEPKSEIHEIDYILKNRFLK